MTLLALNCTAKGHKLPGQTHSAEILRYATVGVIRSAGIDAVTGTMFGGFGDPLDCARTFFTASRDG